MSANQVRGNIDGVSQGQNETPQYLLLSEILDKRVQTQSGITIGKLKDLVFKDDPHYAEVTDLVIERSLGRPPYRIPWSNAIKVSAEKSIVQDSSEGKYPEIKHGETCLFLRDKILDKRILDLEGFEVEVVYDMLLLFVKNKLFVVGADAGRRALLRRLGLGRLTRLVSGNGKNLKEEIIPWRYIQPLPADLSGTKGDVRLTITRERLNDIHPEDMANILEELSHEERIQIFDALDNEAAAGALDATEPRVQREILASTTSERAIQIFEHLSPAQIADIISMLPRDDSEAFLKMLQGDVSSKVNRLLSEHDVPASTLALRRILEFPGNLTAEEASLRFREEAPRCDVTMYIYVVDEGQHLQGVIDINELLQADPKNRLDEIMTKNVVSVTPNTMRGDLRGLFSRYRFRALPIVNESNRIVGVVREKDVFLTEE
jgi:magnesium transporter